MELVSAIEKRRSIRKFQDKEVSNEILLELIRLATLAPSGHNRQPWEFQIVKGETKNKIADMLYNKMIDVEGSTAPNTANIMKDANALIMVYLSADSDYNNLNDILSIGGAVENILLAITDLDLGGLWIGNTMHIKEELKDIVGNKNIVSCIAVGYKDQDPKPRPRKPLNEIIINKLN